MSLLYIELPERVPVSPQGEVLASRNAHQPTSTMLVALLVGRGVPMCMQDPRLNVDGLLMVEVNAAFYGLDPESNRPFLGV